MEFLHDLRPKILRTRLYGDQEFTRFELELLHTPVVQRLYSLKQLGFTDKVYPDAIHARFNHILGATEVVDRMAQKLCAWLREHGAEVFSYYDTPNAGSSEKSVTGEDLEALLRSNLSSLRLMALLHDLTHAAFGHTLEDEVNVFNEKHDDPNRQKRFFNALVAQLIYIWCTEERLHPFEGVTLEELADLNVSTGHKRELSWAQELKEYLPKPDRQKLTEHLRNLEFAFRLLLHLDIMHTRDDGPAATVPTNLNDNLLVSEVAQIISPEVKSRDLAIHRDMFMVDLVGNTICADLLDYARRDAANAGLRIQFDDRFLRYLCVTSVKDKLSPTRQPCIRTAIQIFTDKMRHDVLSEMSGILKARYLINERVLFHPTKCAAGAMLGTAVQLLGLKDLPGWMQVLGDQELLRILTAIARNLETLVELFAARSDSSDSGSWETVVNEAWTGDRRMAGILIEAIRSILDKPEPSKRLPSDQIESLLERARSARNVLWRLRSRRFPKLSYRLRQAHHTGGETDVTIAETYSQPEARYLLERSIEKLCNLPIGSIFIHCPRRKTSMKVAEVLVVGADIGKAAQLRNLTDVSPEGLQPYQDEIRAVQDMYFSIWQFHAYLDVSFWDKQPIVEWALELKLGFPNDHLLEQELSRDRRGAYSLLAGKLKGDIAPNSLPRIIRQVDAEAVGRMRLGQTTDHEADLRRIIREVNAEEKVDDGNQPPLPGVGK
jgi:HD superfamily phosphohydrolase